MEDEFSRARLESQRRKQYDLKVLKNRTAKQFLKEYFNDDVDEGTLKQATKNYTIAHRGVIDSKLIYREYFTEYLNLK
ncbi:MAG: hypothetical protein IJN50_02080 [Clostridia bacterium]|nr:hypothetical protein [Clostridia bacterium]